MKIYTIKTLGYLGILASIFVGTGEYLLHYSEHILGYAEAYEFFQFVPKAHMTQGHFLAMLGLPLYFAGYIHIYYMLRSGNESLARAVLAVGFIAFAIGGVWIGSRVSIGAIVHEKEMMNPELYQRLLQHYTDHMEVLVQVLRIVIALVSILFALTILKGGTYYNKWMALCNPILLLLGIVAIGILLPVIGQHVLPILMNVTHLILFSVSLYQFKNYNQNHQS